MTTNTLHARRLSARQSAHISSSVLSLVTGAFALVVGALTLLASQPAFAIGEQSGRVRGTVIEAESKKPLIAVTVTATSPALIGAPRVAMSNERGRFELRNLPPGEYKIEFSYEGLAPLSRQVMVRLNETVPMNVVWSLTSTTDTVSVVERRKMTRPDSTHTGSVVETTVLSKLPTARSYQDAAQKVAGVSGGANPNIKGGFLRNNRYLIDGIDITDPVTGTFALNMPFDSIEAIDVLTGGLDAQYNAMGGVINMITKNGGDEVAGTAALYFNHSKLSATGDSGTQLYEGESPFRQSATGPNQSMQLSLNLGGYIIKKKLWYRVTYDLRLRESSPARLAPLGVPPYDIQHPSLTSQNHLGSARINWAPADKHRVWSSTTWSPGFFNNVNGGNSSVGIAEDHQNQNAIFEVIGWDWELSDRVSTNIQLGGLYSLIETGPQGWLGEVNKNGCGPGSILPPEVCTYNRNAAKHTNLTDNSTWFQGGAYQNDKRYKLQFDPSVNIRANWFGQHDIKAGFQGQMYYRTRDVRTPGGSTYLDSPTRMFPLADGLCDPANPDPNKCFRRTDSKDFYVRERAYGGGFFLQDRWWTAFEWLTILPGIRADYGSTYDNKGRRVTSMFAVGPRLGITANLTPDARNVAFAYYGRNTEVLSLLAASSVDAVESGSDVTWEFNPMTNAFDKKVSESGGEGGVRVDQKAKAPHTDELTVGLRREIFPNALASVEYTYKKFSNIWASIEVNRIYDPTGSRVVDWKDKTKAGLDIYEYSTPEENYRTYQGFTLMTEGDPSPNWSYGASYNLSWTYGPGVSILGVNKFDNPRQQRWYQGFNPEDLRHYMRLYGAYTWFDVVSTGFNFSYMSGVPLTKLYYNAFDGINEDRRSPIGTAPGAPNDFERISQLRSPDQVDFDLRVSVHVLPKSWKSDLYLSADIFNLFDLRTATAFRTPDNARYGEVSGRKTPRRLQLSATYTY